ncbi:MAG: methyltransferase domain-containing protein [Nitrospira sp.]|jgi:SAM-dependent methyltransferase|nr:methyltransferase domain-containing protein [Nitrospira sp.]
MASIPRVDQNKTAGVSIARLSHPYTCEYYKSSLGPVPYSRYEGKWLQFFGLVADHIVKEIRPRKVLDAGCAKGFLVEALRDRGVEAYGIDLSEYAISEVRGDIKPYCRVASLVDPIHERFDLIVCIEVLEHIPEEIAPRVIANLCRSTDDILFSSTPDDFAEPTHVNVRPRSYWNALFSEQGFDLDVEFDASRIAPHAMRFLKRPVRCCVIDALLKQREQLRQTFERTDEEQRKLIQELERRLEKIEQSIGWKVVVRLKHLREKMCPLHSRRHSIYLALRSALLALMNGEWRSLLNGSPQAGQSSTIESNAAAAKPAPIPISPESALAHSLLDGLKGLEIGPATHNPFGLNTRNVELPAAHEFYAEEQRRLSGLEPPRVDLWAAADNIPVPNQSEGFILTSHILEHLPNVVGALLEWDRIVIDGGYVFMIVPHKWAFALDASRELTSFEHFIDDYGQKASLESHPLEGVPGGKMGHYHTFTPDSVLQVVEWMCRNKLCDWTLVAREDIDTKVGNGFTLAFMVRHQDRAGFRDGEALS